MCVLWCVYVRLIAIVLRYLQGIYSRDRNEKERLKFERSWESVLCLCVYLILCSTTAMAKWYACATPSKYDQVEPNSV